MHLYGIKIEPHPHPTHTHSQWTSIIRAIAQTFMPQSKRLKCENVLENADLC